MTIAGFFFYLFSVVVVASGLMVITARNPVHSVLFLILAFFNAAGLFVLLGAEFLAMILVIVYVGAVAVLFLFVVMTLDVDFSRAAQRKRTLPAVGLSIGAILLAELLFVAGTFTVAPGAIQALQAAACHECGGDRRGSSTQNMSITSSFRGAFSSSR